MFTTTLRFFSLCFLLSALSTVTFADPAAKRESDSLLNRSLGRNSKDEDVAAELSPLDDENESRCLSEDLRGHCLGETRAYLEAPSAGCQFRLDGDQLRLVSLTGDTMWETPKPASSVAVKQPVNLKINPTVGQLALVDSDQNLLWLTPEISADLSGPSKGPFSLELQDDCKVRLYDGAGVEIWSAPRRRRRPALE